MLLICGLIKFENFVIIIYMKGQFLDSVQDIMLKILRVCIE